MGQSFEDFVQSLSYSSRVTCIRHFIFPTDWQCFPSREHMSVLPHNKRWFFNYFAFYPPCNYWVTVQYCFLYVVNFAGFQVRVLIWLPGHVLSLKMDGVSPISTASAAGSLGDRNLCDSWEMDVELGCDVWKFPPGLYSRLWWILQWINSSNNLRLQPWRNLSPV
jgi:hypothetical protein